MHRILVVLALAVIPTWLVPAVANAQPRDRIEQGRSIYAARCVWCHGIGGVGVDASAGLEGPGGVTGAGPPLVDVGTASVDFYLSTGYMPLEHPDDAPARDEPPSVTPAERRALLAYLESIGTGTPIPTVDLAEGDVAEGMRAFTENCAACHQVVAQGGLTAGAVAPELTRATPTQIAEAIRIGPYVMPAFSESQIDDATVASIVRYVEYTKHPEDPGGWPIGHIGPIPEGLVAWIVAAFGLVAVTRLIAGALR